MRNTQRRSRSSRVTALILTFLMTLVFIPTFSYADEAEGITVYLTVSNQGVLAQASDGSVMVQKPVTVTDIDGDGAYTYDEALVAAHDAYFEGGAAAGYDPGSGFVKKLWGVDSTNNLFFINGNGLGTGVTVDTVQADDVLYASINADSKYYADWYTAFEPDNMTAYVNEEVTLNLKGHLGMAFAEEDKVNTPIEGVTVKDTTGKEYGTTDEEGNVSLSFSAPGTYIITAAGTTKGAAYDFSLIDLSSGQGWPRGTMSEDMSEWNVAYTDDDYGDGPYPAEEIKYIDFFEEADEDSENDYAWQDLHYLKSNRVIMDCPIMAPAAVVTVYGPVDKVKQEIETLPYDASALTAEDKERIEGILADYNALSEEDQAIIDSTFNHPNGDTQSYGRVLEASVWAVHSFDTDTSTTLTDGTYTTETEPAVSSMSDKGKSDSSRVRQWWVESIVVEDGQATAYIYVTSGTNPSGKKLTTYPSVWVGGKTVERNADNNYPIPVDLNGTTYFGGVSSSMPRPIMYALDTTIDEPVIELAVDKTEAGMMKPSDTAYLTGGRTVCLPMENDSFNAIFVGDGREVDEAKVIELADDNTFTFEVEEYDKEMFVAFKSKKSGNWLNKRITVSKTNGTLVIVDDKADYSAVEAALAAVPKDLSIYTDETRAAVEEAVAVVEGEKTKKNSVEQEAVDAMAKAINDAVAALKGKPGWAKEDSDWVYFNNDGTKLTNGWAKANAGWCWMDANGKWTKSRWIKDSGSWYYIKPDGYMAANQWVKASGGWCYVSASGRMVTNGWVKDSKGWCWMGSDGYWVKNRWIQDKGTWYYIKSDGYMASSQWVKTGGQWYYLKASGAMAAGEWVKSGGSWYYLKANGYMATGTQTINGRTYRFNSSGKWIN